MNVTIVTEAKKKKMQKRRTKLCGCGVEILARTALDDDLSGKVNFE